MKILQITNKVPYPANDGGAIACMNLTRGFALLGHEVTVFAMNTLKHHTDLSEIPEQVKDWAEFRLVDVPARISPFSAAFNLIFSVQPYNAVRFISKPFANGLKKLLKEKEFDIIQLEGLYVCPYIPLIRKYSNAKIVYRAHNIEHEIWERTAALSKGLRRFYLKILSKRIKVFEKGFINRYDLIVPITERDGIILDKMGNVRPAHVSPTGIETTVLIPHSKNLEHPSLFHIGSLEWAPNQEGIIWFIDKCWPKIHEKFPNLKFYIAGRKAPDWLVRRFDAPNIVFMGEVEDAYEFMNSKSIMVVPLFSGSGMRIKVIEGMALGKPIVSTPIGTEGISTQSGRNILIADNEKEFVADVERLIIDNELFNSISRNAIEYIQEKFDNLALAGALTDFYKMHIE
ncbi:Glycosyltransferase involved in cell wall bisynthesis [Mariniphaga anaerophila]|uniref:Glycosyltransferase involved in cell wall bisynthesis n=1 Tax=Mariniphaga anaerophila TaxID=1484053 RepID=A0A1M4SFJ6_9BACT|nr:glycosyltransferase family 4 protein [Mariniphaga anaerophila]SHE30938.1 Glycosyltransferase involved in cell wall bisynthesis [Mariniphaga anaerophila]